MTRLQEMQEQRNKLVTDMRALLEKPEFSDEDKAEFERMEEDESHLHKRIEQLHAIEQRLEEMGENEQARLEEARKRARDSGIDTPLPDHRTGEDPDERVNINRCFRAWALGKSADKKDIEYARSVGYPLAAEVELTGDRGRTDDDEPVGFPKTIQEAEQRKTPKIMRRDLPALQKRQQATDPGSAGGFTVPQDMMRAIDIALLAFGGVRMSSTIVPTATGRDMPIPTTNDTNQLGEIIAENAAANEQDVVFGQIVLGAFKYSSKIVRVSYELLQDSATNIPALLGRLLGERIGRIQSNHMTTGVGTTEPTGIVTASTDSTVVTASATAITWAEMLDLEHSVDPAYRGPGAGWMMNDQTFKLIKQIQDTQERPLWQPSLVAGAPDMFDGFPIYINQSMAVPATSAITVLFGQLNKFWIRDVLGYTLIRLDERYAEFAQVGFLAWARADSNLIDAGTNPVKYLSMSAT